MLRENRWALHFGSSQDSTELLAALAVVFSARWTST